MTPTASGRDTRWGLACGLVGGRPLYWRGRQTAETQGHAESGHRARRGHPGCDQEDAPGPRHGTAPAGLPLHRAGDLRLRGRDDLLEGVALHRPRRGVRERGRLPRHADRRRAPAGVPRRAQARSTPSATSAGTGASRSRAAKGTPRASAAPITPGSTTWRASCSARRTPRRSKTSTSHPARCRGSGSTPGAATSS